MALSKYGCMPKLIDFLRVNEDNELLEIIGKHYSLVLSPVFLNISQRNLFGVIFSLSGESC